MIKNYVIIAFRRFFRNKITSMIKLLSLVVAMICFILIALYAFSEYSYDRFNKNADEIVRVSFDVSINGNQETWALTGTKLGPEIQRNFPLVKSFTRLSKHSEVVKSDEALFNEENFLFVDSGFLNMFSFPLVEGDKNTALNAPGKIILTKSVAARYFGSEDPMGKSLLLNGKQHYTVTGVASDPPDNSQIQFDFLASFDNLEDSKTESWFPANFLTYLLLDKGTNEPQLEGKVNTFIHDLKDEEFGISGLDYFRFNLEPLTQVHLHSNVDGFTPNSPVLYIRILILVAMLILATGYINYTNLTLAQASRQETEVIIRRVLGSGRNQLFIHFFTESVIYSLISIILSFYLVTLLLPYFNALTEKSLTASLMFNPIIISIILVSSLFISIIAGLYPTFVILKHTRNNRLKPEPVKSVKGGSIRRTLIVFQFIVSITLIIITLVIQKQRSYIRNKNIGYDRDNVISVQMGSQVWPSYYKLKDALKSDPHVEDVSAGYTSPTEIRWTSFMTVATETGEKKFITRAIPVDLDFINTLGIKIIAGSDFTRSDFKRLKDSTGRDNYKIDMIVNEATVKQIGWTPEEAIGRNISAGFSGRIKAVVKDFNIASMHEQIMPLMIFLFDNYINTMIIKTKGKDVPAALASIKKIWNEYVPAKPFDYRFLNDEYNALYKKEQKEMQVFSSFAVISIFLACMGLFGLVAVIIVQRTKEIAIRKIMGASVKTVVINLLADYTKPVLIAILIAFPIAYYASSSWLKGFAYRISIHYSIFILSGLLILAIALLTISYQAVKAALSNPAASIRHE